MTFAAKNRIADIQSANYDLDHMHRLSYADEPRRGPGDSKLNYEYDEFGRVVNIKNAQQVLLANFLYQIVGNEPQASITEYLSPSQPFTVKDRYDEKGYNVAIEQGGYITTGSWDDTCNLLSKVDFNNIYTKYDYDETGNIRYEKNIEYFTSGPQKETTKEFRGPCNGITKLINPRSKTTTWQYDNNGNVRFIYEPIGKTTQNIYDYSSGHTGDLIETIDPNSNHTTYGYDQWGNLNRITIINPQGDNIVTEYVNDSLGRRTQKTDPLSRITTQHWNIMDKVDNITFFESAQTTQINRTYDTRGRLTQEIDSSGHITKYLYDDNSDRIIEMTRYKEYSAGGSPILSSAIRTVYDYDLKGNLIKFKKYGSNNQCLQTIQYEYDWLNRVVSKTEPGQQPGTTRTTGYNYWRGYNSPANIVYSNGDGIISTYDCFGRFKTSQNRKGDGSEIERFEYDANDNMLSAEGPYGKTSYTYDDLDRLGNVTYQYKNCPQVIIGYGYDKIGNRTGMTRFVGGLGEHLLEMDYTYDFANRLTSATHSLFGTVDYTYDKASNRKTMTYPNKIAKITYDYDAKNRITDLTYKDKNGAAISSVNYAYFNNGNRRTMANEFGTTNYEYDGLDQITKVATPRWGTHSYEYDDLGNRLTLTTNEPGNEKTISYTYDPANELRTINDSGTVTLDYDAKGNCIRKGNVTYEWNHLDQLIRIKKSGKFEFTYDQQGRRIRKIDSSGARYYFYDGLEPIFELDGSGNIITEQFSIGGELIAKSVQYPVSSVQQKTYHLNDNLGSTVFILDSTGNLLANHYHDPFGKAWNVKGDIGNDIRFTGKEYEEDIDLYYFAMRWYDPEVGRFVSVDLLEALGYVYVWNNPIKYIDFFGFAGMTLTELKALEEHMIGIKNLEQSAAAQSIISLSILTEPIPAGGFPVTYGAENKTNFPSIGNEQLKFMVGGLLNCSPEEGKQLLKEGVDVGLGKVKIEPVESGGIGKGGGSGGAGFAGGGEGGGSGGSDGSTSGKKESGSFWNWFFGLFGKK